MAPIAIIGASGGVGRAAVKQLLQQDRDVRAIGRSKEKLQKMFGTSDRLQIAEASVEDKESLTAALDGVSGVINACAGSSYWSAAGVDCQGSGNVAEVAQAAGVHVVLISSRLVTSKHRFHLFRMLLNNVRYSMMDYKLKGEELLRKSGAAYTIIRPGHLTNSTGGSNELDIGQGDGGRLGHVSRADVAAVAIAALDHPSASNRKTIDLSVKTHSAPPADLLLHVFDGTVPDE